MFKLSSVLMLTAALSLSACAPSAMQSTNVEKIPLDLTGISNLDVQTIDGAIRVKTGDVASLTITKKGAIRYSTERQAKTLAIRAEMLEKDCVDCLVEFDLVLPTALNQKLVALNGSIQSVGEALDIYASTNNGTIQTQKTGKANLNLMTAKGNIFVDQAQGEIFASTNQGDLIFSNIELLRNSTNTARTDNGAIRLSGIKTLGGLLIEGQVWNGYFDLNVPGFTVSGDSQQFSAQQQGESSALFNLETKNGNITVRP